MKMKFNAADWYWRVAGDDAHVHSSARAATVPIDDALYVQWLAAGGRVLRPRAPDQVQREIVAAIQARLDAFAQTRGYDGILSACTYANSAVPKFAAEGTYCVGGRDATWAGGYAILAAVQAGARAMPGSYADIAGELPPLAWPA